MTPRRPPERLEKTLARVAREQGPGEIALELRVRQIDARPYRPQSEARHAERVLGNVKWCEQFVEQRLRIDR